MWQMRLALALTAATLASAWDVSEWLSVQGKADEAAVQKAKCWCEDLTGALDTRITEADSQIRALESSKNIKHFQNEQLKLEIKSRHEEVGENTESLGVASSLSDKAKQDTEEEVANLESSLKSVRKAIEAMPEGKGSSTVHGALRGLEDNFGKKLKEVQDQHERRQTKFQELQRAKEKMLRLQKKEAVKLQSRLAEGMAAEAEAGANLEVYSGQREVDVVMRGAARELCAQLETQATERQKVRQAAEIAVSQARADAAKEEATNTALKLALLSRGKHGVPASGAWRLHLDQPRSVNVSVHRQLSLAEEAKLANDCDDTVERAKDTKAKAAELVEGAKKSAQGLQTLVEKSPELEKGLGAMLHEQMATGLVAQGRVAPNVKAQVSAVFDLAQAHLKTLSAPFDKVRTASRECFMADRRVVTQLSSAKARAAEAVVEAMKCESLLQRQ